MNEFSQFKENHPSASRLKVGCCRNEVGQNVPGFFTEIEILGMIEAADYKQIDLVSTFFEKYWLFVAINTGKYPLSELITLYVGLVSKMFKRNGEPGWAQQEFSDLQNHINKFREKSNRFLSHIKFRAKERQNGTHFLTW